MNTIKWSRHSCRIDPIKRSTYPFCQGERNAVGRSRMPIARTRALNAAPNARSLSRTRYFGALSQGNASVIWRKPLCRWVSGHRNPQQLPPSMAENKKREQLLKGNRRNHKEINRRTPLHMIAKEGLPRLQWSIAPRQHVDRNRGLGDLDAEL